METLQHGSLIKISGDRERTYSTYRIAVASALFAEWNVTTVKYGRPAHSLDGRADWPFATPLPTVITAWREPAPVIAATVALGEEVAFEGLSGTYTVQPEHNGHIRFESTDPALAARQKAERDEKERKFWSQPGAERWMSE